MWTANFTFIVISLSFSLAALLTVLYTLKTKADIKELQEVVLDVTRIEERVKAMLVIANHYRNIEDEVYKRFINGNNNDN